MDMGRPGLHSEGQGFITDSRHHIVGPELLSKRFKDQDSDLQQATPRGHSQRPDIIEREVIGKSMPPRDRDLDLHPHPQPSVVSMDTEMPEHYDLENASSIAPSDIDIVYHYKGFREGANLRKYSPHFPPHPRDSPRSVIPPPVTRVESPKQVVSTPLARLSPSSELSQQMPRILTLSDISGKPLQSALLATTSSSGGVGKDHSERSLNSPVMSQLSGHSTPLTSQHLTAQHLTSQQINRLNAARPRTSSLVSTLDAVSSSSGHGVNDLPSNHPHMNGDDAASSTSTDESGNDSFTCSEIE
ncbi:cadherin-related tumor suppressor-like [Diaphorina citri]|uniref:Cadherin-related tumor suppressor-like n=1 Tax=Diaphorina citri TaxID=121845 RepID=A0A3Q0ISK5_DIACI|nr:cadherin-related tumor suppressor-like [Diaphorina citri]